MHFFPRRLGNSLICVRAFSGPSQTDLPQRNSSLLFQLLELPGCGYNDAIPSSLRALVGWPRGTDRETGFHDMGEPCRRSLVHDRVDFRLSLRRGDPAGIYPEPVVYSSQFHHWSTFACIHTNVIRCNEVFLLFYFRLSRLCCQFYKAVLAV